MHQSNFLTFFIILEVFTFLYTFRFYQAAGRKAWEAAIPVYKTYVLLKIIKRPTWQIFLFFIPVVSNLMTLVALYELLHVFNYRKWKDFWTSVITLGGYLLYLQLSTQLRYVGRDNAYIKKHVGETLNSLVFAVVVASVLRAFTFEAYVIPTPSMEKTLLVGDFLFVSKMHYGNRLTITPLSIPLMHSKIPLLNFDCFVDWVQLPYIRLPKFQDIKRFDNVVFNWPMESDLPIDKRMNYIKRCVGLPGDTLEIIDRELIINGQKPTYPDRTRLQFEYFVRTNGAPFNKRILHDKLDIYYSKDLVPGENDFSQVRQINQNEYLVFIPEDKVDQFKSLPNVEEVIPVIAPREPGSYESNAPLVLKNYIDRYLVPNSEMFPNRFHSDIIKYANTRDNYGPVYIPKKGATVQISPDNIEWYERIISVYEGNELQVTDSLIYINGKQADSYTFKQNYYWMMGDNRHNSLDSRYWGFVPEDHIVGKPVFIWMSYDKTAEKLTDRIRTKRVFTTVHGEGKPRSYFWHFVVVVAVLNLLWKYVIKKIRDKKRNLPEKTI
ncbi:MAG: signal peptidase I [Thermaurantimonas sp.]|uniref:signal peptidase I n=1 Tax=Thermaurantimonas sp. TaxID=2681568 RepID=UPI003918A78C